MFGDYRLESRSPVYIGDVLRRVVGRVLMCVYITHHVVCTSTLRTIRTGLPKNPQKILISYLYLDSIPSRNDDATLDATHTFDVR